MRVKFPSCVTINLLLVFRKNPTLHSRAKHIEIKHHFIRDHVQNEIVDLQFIPTNDQLADIFMKPLTEERLIPLRSQLGMISVND